MIRYILLFCLLYPTTLLAELSVESQQGVNVVTSITTQITQIQTESGIDIGSPVTRELPPEVKKTGCIGVLAVTSDKDLTDRLTSTYSVECDTAEVTEVSPYLYTVTKPGTHYIKVTVVSGPPFKWESAIGKVVVGSSPGPNPGPGPEPPPDPDDCSKVPEDQFNNLGRAACASKAGLSPGALTKAPEVAKAYLATANALDDPSSGVLTLNDARDFLARGFVNAFGEYSVEWQTWGANIGKHSMGVSLNRTNFADVCRAIAVGLGGTE